MGGGKEPDLLGAIHALERIYDIVLSDSSLSIEFGAEYHLAGCALCLLCGKPVELDEHVSRRQRRALCTPLHNENKCRWVDGAKTDKSPFGNWIKTFREAIGGVAGKILWANLSFWDPMYGRQPLLAHVSDPGGKEAFKHFWANYQELTNLSASKGLFTLNEFAARCAFKEPYIVVLDPPPASGSGSKEGLTLKLTSEIYREIMGTELSERPSPTKLLEKVVEQGDKGGSSKLFDLEATLSTMQSGPSGVSDPKLARLIGACYGYWKASASRLANIYFFPVDIDFLADGGTSHAPGYESAVSILAVGTNASLQAKEFKFLDAFARTVLKRVLMLNFFKGQRREATKSAVAAIMSRNMSHNLGSHVLSRLGRLKDGGGWYTQKYLQQRMDFLAQVSTERPSWEEPAWLLQDLARWFLHQKDMLEYIAASEGLRAHRFMQGEESAGKVKEGRTERGDIRLHVLLVPEAQWLERCPSGEGATDGDGKVAARIKALRDSCGDSGAGLSPDEHLPCTHGPARPADGPDCRRVLLSTAANESDGGAVRTDEDQLVAIPGGLVGWQGFYIVLENVLRNAAKHGKRKRGKALHVVVEILYDPDCTLSIRDDQGEKARVAPCALLRVYDSASPVGDGGVALWGEKGINHRLQQNLIDEKGKLRQGNWGLSEMRIAAAYLQRRTIDHVGGGGEMVTGRPPRSGGDGMDDTMLKAARNGGSPHILRAVPSPIGTLAYEFYLLRPLSLGIAFAEEALDPTGGAS